MEILIGFLALGFLVTRKENGDFLGSTFIRCVVGAINAWYEIHTHFPYVNQPGSLCPSLRCMKTDRL